MIVIFDLDGTLADCRHRLHFVENSPKDWKSFFYNMHNDEPVNSLIKTLNYLKSTGDDCYGRPVKIIICSGRPDNYKSVTKEWLINSHIEYDYLIMRKEGDYRADHIVKKEILDQLIKDGMKPDLVIDDRQSVVDMWRANGITCLQAKL